MDKLGLTIAKWSEIEKKAQEQREQIAITGGVSGQSKGETKEQLSAADAYLKLFRMFLSDLRKLK